MPNGLTMDNTYGAALLGTFFALMCVADVCHSICGAPANELFRMYGVLLHQTYNYFRVHSADSHWTKLYVRTTRVFFRMKAYTRL